MTKRELKKRYEELKEEYEELKGQNLKSYTELCKVIEMYRYLAGINKESDTYLFKYNGKIFRVLSYETSKEVGCHEDLILRCKEVEIKNE